jgi:hypothetical protein
VAFCSTREGVGQGRKTFFSGLLAAIYPKSEVMERVLDFLKREDDI